MAKKKSGSVGSSVFTHQDDLGADLHPSDPYHHEAMFYGGNVPRKHQLQEVVLGPPAFGSPDPRTLGHTMQPATDADSAPDLSPDYAGGKPVAGINDDEGSSKVEKTWKKSDSKEDLLKEAQSRDLDVTDENTKAEIIDALEEDDDENADNDEDEEENQ